jgi:acetylornithine deacetylase/succinyl-diaminopimelate desuccinylase-like protein
MIDTQKLTAFVDQVWDDEIVPTLVEYIRIPNKSPAFDPDWVAHGHMERAVGLFEAWARSKIAALPGAEVEVIRLEGRTPVILVTAPGEGPTTLLYGHLDKQPEMTGWAEDLGPWVPVIKDGKLYGRGGADDGYALFGALTAILSLHEQGAAHGRCVILIEACEESGSYDLPAYVEHLAERIGSPSLVICLDSGCGNYEQLWLTTSLRGLSGGTLKVEVLEEGVHSGSASGIVPSSFRILRQLLTRIEDPETGQVLPEDFAAEIPPARIAQAKKAAEALGDEVYKAMPFVPGMRPVTDDPAELLLNRSWRPQLAVTGAAGLPLPENAGNVLRPYTTAKLSLRLPPTVSAEAAGEALRQILERDPPYGARVTFTPDHPGSGWNAPELAPWLEAALEHASSVAFGRPAAMIGEGGSIPFMGMLGERFPAAQFVITGVLGPHSNAHGPNEFLHIRMGKNVTAAMALILAAHVTARAKPGS